MHRRDKYLQVERLKLVMRETGLNARGLARITGVVPGTVYNYINPDIDRQIGFDFAYALLKKLGYNPFWLVFGEGEKRFPQKFLPRLTEGADTSYDHFEVIDKERFFQKQIEKAGIRDIIEKLIGMKRSEIRMFRVIFEKMYPRIDETSDRRISRSKQK